MAAVEGPDRGFSWVIALCCSYIHFALFGLFRSSGVMYVAMLQNYDVTREEASWPFALCAAVFQLVGPVASVLTHYVSQRKVCLLGAAIATFGIGSCYFADSVMWINVFFGLVHGLGFGFVVTIVPVTLNQYFVKHRATAMGIAFSGGTVSSLIFPSVMEWLLENYTLKDSFLLLSGVVMNTLVAASLLREPSWLKKSKTTKEIDDGALSKTPGGAQEIDNTHYPLMYSPGDSLDIDGNRNALVSSVDAAVAKDVDGNKSIVFSSKKSRTPGGAQEIDNTHCPLMDSPGDCLDIDGNRNALINSSDAAVAKGVDGNKSIVMSSGAALVTKDIDGNRWTSKIPMTTPEEALITKDVDGNGSSGAVGDMDKHKNALNISMASSGIGLVARDNDGNRCPSNMPMNSARSIANGGNSKIEQHSGAETERLPNDKIHNGVPFAEVINPDRALFDASVGKTIQNVALHKNELEVREPLLSDKKIVIVPKKTLAEPNQEEHSICHSIHQVLKEPMFHLLAFTMCIYFLVVHSFFMVIVDFAKDKGIPEGKAIYIISMFSLTDLFGRAGLGWVTDRGFISRKAMVALNLGVLGVVNQLYPLIDSLEGILGVAAIHGLAVGSSITLFFVLQAECLGMDRLALVIGLTSFINGVSSLFRPGIIGLFRDVIGAYDLMFHFLGFLSMVFSVLWIVVSLRDRKLSKRHRGGKV